MALIIITGVWLMTSKESNNEEIPYMGHGGAFKNPLAEIDTPDPSIVYRDGYYYMTFTHNGTDVMVMKSRTLDFHQAQRKVIWYPPVDTRYSANIWAPEIQYLRGKWYIYFAADDGHNENHRMYVLEADTEDPLGTYSFKGQLTDDTDKWAIDGLVLEHDNQLYYIWSGWEGEVNIAQNTYIAAMSDPLTVSGPRILLSKPDMEWERAGGPPYINEGQAILQKDGRVFLMYSGAGSWTPFYSLGMLTLEPGDDPLVASNWKKSKQPLLQMDDEAGVYGPGHNTFVSSPDGTEEWIVYHATSGIHDGWNNRKARAQKIVWDEEGNPQIGKPLALDSAIPVPSGTGVFKAEHAVIRGDRLEFDLIPSSVETKAPLMIRYRNSADMAQAITIWINDKQVDELELPVTESETIGYIYSSIPLQLQAGSNKIGIGTTGSSVHIHSIELPRYEAEAAQTHGNGEAIVNPFSSGWGVARLTEGDGEMLSFDHTVVPRSGTYQIALAMSNPSEQAIKVELKVNGGQKQLITIPPTDRNIYKPIKLEIKLESGDNRITLNNASGRLDIDYMDITF